MLDGWCWCWCLQDVGYNGWMSIVYEGQDDLEEMEAMRKATAYLRSALHKHKL